MGDQCHLSIPNESSKINRVQDGASSEDWEMPSLYPKMCASSAGNRFSGAMNIGCLEALKSDEDWLE
jgi:hypothetical protein